MSGRMIARAHGQFVEAAGPPAGYYRMVSAGAWLALLASGTLGWSLLVSLA